jgi:hypothetical protein
VSASGRLVQAVHILRNYSGYNSRTLELCNGCMGGVRPYRREAGPADCAPCPIAGSCRFASNEFPVLDWRRLSPGGVGSAVVRNPGLGTDACAAQHYYVTPLQHFEGGRHLFMIVHGPIHRQSIRRPVRVVKETVSGWLTSEVSGTKMNFRAPKHLFSGKSLSSRS